MSSSKQSSEVTMNDITDIHKDSMSDVQLHGRLELYLS